MFSDLFFLAPWALGPLEPVGPLGPLTPWARWSIGPFEQTETAD